MPRNAIVIGGSIAGLLAARVLARHFDSVTVVERDVGEGTIQARKGVPQGDHIHLLWSGGMKAIESLFPGLANELVTCGGAVFDNAGDMRWYHHGVWKKRLHSGLMIHSQSRPLLEHCLRQRLQATAGVSVRSGYSLNDLVWDASHSRVTGVRLTSHVEHSDELTLDSDLVIDASGRGCASLKSLARSGYPLPEEEAIGVDIGYSTRIFRRCPADGRNWQSMAIYPKAPFTHRLGVLFPIEGERWIVTLVGLRGHYTRLEADQDFLDFACSLEQPDLFDAIESATPEGPIRHIRYANQMRRRFERMRTFPGGLLHLGDSICSLNPLYGQGMTVAALESQILDECLHRCSNGSSPESDLAGMYFRRVAKVVDAAWLLGAGSDFLYPETTGQRPFYMRFLGWYIARILQLSGSSDLIHTRFLQVIHFERPPWQLLLPDALLRVLSSTLRQKLSTGYPQ